jgi:hypothetical protein
LIVDYTRAIELTPQFVVAYGNRANAHEKTGDIFRAAADRQKASELQKSRRPVVLRYKTSDELGSEMRNINRRVRPSPSLPVQQTQTSESSK